MNLAEQLRTQIKTELMKIDEVSYPHVYKRTATKVGYQKLEEEIISIMLAQNVIVSTAISIIESEEL